MRNRTKNSTNAGRYSNWPASNGGFLTGGYESTGGLTGGLAGGGTTPTTTTTTSGSDWTSQDTVGVINTGASLIQNVVNAIFGRSDQYRADALNQMYTQEKRSNTILWVVIGLVLALGVFLVVRKTK